MTDAPRRRCELKARTLYYTRRDPKSGDSIGFTKKLRLGTRAYEARFSKDEIALRSLALKVTEAMLDVSIIKKKPVEPIEQPKKKAFRTIRKEITLRAADLATAARGPSLEMWWASLAPGVRQWTARGTTSRRARKLPGILPKGRVFQASPMMIVTRRRSCPRRRCLLIGARSGPWRLLRVRARLCVCVSVVCVSKELLSFTRGTRRGGSALAAFRPFFSVRVLRLDA